MKRQVTAVVVVFGAGAGALAGGGAFAGAQQQAQQPPVQSQPAVRQAPRNVTINVNPRVDRRRPWRFTVSGRVNLPAPGLVCPPGQTSGYYCLPLARERACDRARVAIRFKGGPRTRQTISTRRYRTRIGGTAQQLPFCTYRGTVSFNVARRLRPTGRVQVDVRFLGNAYYGQKSSPRRTARAVGVGRRR